MMEPKIRFKGFDSRLDKSLIGDFCHISTGKSNTQDKKDDGIYPFYVRSPHIERSNKYLYDEEAVLTVGDGVGTGKVFHYVNGKYDLHQRVYRMFNFKDINAKYFYYLFSQKFYKRVMSMTAKSSVDSVRLEMISKMEIEYPSINEQETIANYFTSLDSQISASTSRLASLKQMKAASLQAMFPQEGKTVPKIRFKGFEGEWTWLKLGDISEQVKRKAPINSTAPVMMISALNGFINQSEKYSDNNAGSSLANYTLLKKGELSYNHGYSKTRNFGSCFNLLVEEARIPFVYHSFRLTNNNDSFYAYYLNSGTKDKDLKRLVSSTARMDGLLNISFKNYMELSVPHPSLAEQQAIASYFTSLDRQISLQSQRLEKLKQIKSACLDKMFV